MRLTKLVAVAALGLVGCATSPKYCASLRQQWETKISAMPDWDVAWIGTALSHTGYAGNCACPDDAASDGSHCGARSAYSKGARLACTPADIPRQDLPVIRHQAVTVAMPVECGGLGDAQGVNWPPTPADKIPSDWR